MTYDADLGTGSVVLDDGTTLPFASAAFAASGLRVLRAGQRLSVEVQGAGPAAQVVAMRLGSIGRVPPPAPPGAVPFS